MTMVRKTKLLWVFIFLQSFAQRFLSKTSAAFIILFHLLSSWFTLLQLITLEFVPNVAYGLESEDILNEYMNVMEWACSKYGPGA